MDENEIPDAMLERYLRGELDEQTHIAIEEEARINPALQKRLDKLRPSALASLRQFNLRETKVKAGKKILTFFKMALTLLAIIAITALIITLVPKSSLRYKTFTELSEFRSKKNITELLIYRKQGNTLELLEQHSIVRKGDLIQIEYFSKKQSYGMIFSIDGNSKITIHAPLKSKDAELLHADKKVMLEKFHEINEAPGFITFYLLTSPQKFNIAGTIKNLEETIAASEELKKSGQKEFHFETSADIVSVTLQKEKQ